MYANACPTIKNGPPAQRALQWLGTEGDADINSSGNNEQLGSPKAQIPINASACNDQEKLHIKDNNKHEEVKSVCGNKRKIEPVPSTDKTIQTTEVVAGKLNVLYLFAGLERKGSIKDYLEKASAKMGFLLLHNVGCTWAEWWIFITSFTHTIKNTAQLELINNMSVAYPNQVFCGYLTWIKRRYVQQSETCTTKSLYRHVRSAKKTRTKPQP